LPIKERNTRFILSQKRNKATDPPLVLFNINSERYRYFIAAQRVGGADFLFFIVRGLQLMETGERGDKVTPPKN
jgi:hypothetical protein